MEYFWDIVQIVFADIILSGDNALGCAFSLP